MNFIKKRLITYAVVLLVVLQLEFILPRLAPGNAAAILASSSKFGPQAAALVAQRFGLNQPLYVQYIQFYKDIFSWPPYFGLSYQYYPEPVTTLFATRIGWTLLLIVTSLALSVVITYFMASFASLRRGGKFELGSAYYSILTYTIPVYWIGMILLWTFGVGLHWFPTFGTAGFNPGSGLTYVYSVFIHSILPITTLTIAFVGANYLILRGTVQAVLKEDYVFAARTRGLRDRTIAGTYILRNALLPWTSVMSFSVAQILSLIILVESVFGYTGVGDLIVDGVVNYDYPVVVASLFFLSVMVIIGGIIGDFMLLRLDPRLRG